MEVGLGSGCRGWAVARGDRVRRAIALLMAGSVGFRVIEKVILL
jgi:hypothetical protein